MIQIVLPGGMAHQESWDPKPECCSNIAARSTSPRRTSRASCSAKTFRRMAKLADKLTIIRSLAGKEADHGRASYTMFTGYRKSPAIDHPSLGSVVRTSSAPKLSMPPYVAVPNATEYAGTGYLGSQFGPFGIGGDPGRNGFQVRDLVLPQGVDDTPLRQAAADSQRGRQPTSARKSRRPKPGAMDEFYQRAYAMISSPAARDAFDIGKENQKTKDLYGSSEAGVRFMLARRLVEVGRAIRTVSYGSWDHHSGIEQGIRRQSPVLDQALAGLIATSTSAACSTRRWSW